MIRNSIFLLIFIFTIVSITAQEKNELKVDENGNPVVSPEMLAIMREKQRKQREILERFDLYAALSVKVTVGRVPQTGEVIKIRRQEIDKLNFIFSIENISQTEFDFIFNDGSRLVRPELSLSGRKINYSQNMKQLLRQSDDKPSVYNANKIIFEPGAKRSIPDYASVGKIKKWYEPLEPGFYQLVFHMYHYYDRENVVRKRISTTRIFLEIEP